MSGRHAPRSKKGCLSCRVRKLKCDEQRPECLRCKTGFIKCEWYSVPIRRRSARKEVVPRESCRPLQPSIDQSSVATDGFTYQIEFHELMHNFQPILTRSLGADHIPLQNSVILGPNDRELFQFFPCSILAFNYGKGWEWSALSYIYNNTAKYNSGVMHMIMAMSAKELQLQRVRVRRNSHSLLPGPSVSEAGDAHYCLALNELSQLLNTSTSLTDDHINTILAIFFLMVFYEALFGHNNTTTSIHLQGMVSFFQNSAQLSGLNGHQLSIDRLPALSQHLLLLTLACNLTVLQENPNSRTSFEYFIGEPSGNFYDQLYEAAHHTLPRVWDTRYPVEELLDDLENLRALDLTHECNKLRFRIETLKQSCPDLFIDIFHMIQIRDDLIQVRQKFEDLLRLPRFVQGPESAPRRMIRTTLIAAADLYGTEIFCHQVICGHFNKHDCHQSSLEDLIEVAKKALNIDMRLLGRICWPMLIASLETNDMDQKAWICTAFEEMNAKHGSVYGIERILGLA